MSVSYFGMLSKTQKEQVLKLVAKESARLFKIYKQSVREALAFKSLPEAEKLQMYRARSEEVWARIQAQIPRIYQEQISEWQIYEMRAAHHQLNQWNPFGAKSNQPAYMGEEI